MVINIPQYHKFPQSLREKIFQEIGHSPPEWEISVTQNHDLAWSIVLSFLMTTNNRNRKDFSRRLKALTGSNEKEKVVKKAILNFNPFRNRYSCFHDEVLKNVVDSFIKHLEWDNVSHIFDKLSVACKVLKCSILLIRDYVESENYQIFKRDGKTVKTSIVLIASSFEDFDNPMLHVTIYNFMIADALGQIMKKAALQYYLKETDVSKKAIKKLKHAISEEDTFIKAVLKSKYKNAILDVYKSPYIISKLVEAGCEMDPTAIDSEGFSGLYYALAVKDAEILCKLYYFAVDNYSQDEVSFRDPDPNILSNLQNIEELLNDLSKLKNLNSDQDYSDIETKFEELLRVNRFVIELNKRILKIKSRLNYYESTSDIVFEATKRRDIILSILDTYAEFIKYEESSTLLDDYIFHNDYYFLIDIIATTFFFDNITFLKERLNLENEKQFSDIESSFFFLIIYNLGFKKPEFVYLVKELTCYSSEQMLIFPLLYRFDNFHIMMNFNEILRDVIINKDNVVNCIPANEMYSIFHSHPVIKNVLGMARLMNCVAICKTLRVVNIKSVLTIERVLQVIGESVTLQENAEFYFKGLLFLCLPKEISQLLRRLRNQLTHLKGHAFPSKFKCEENISLFRSILNEINEIYKYFRSVNSIITLSYYIQLTDNLEFFLQRIKNSRQQRDLFPRSFVISTFFTVKFVFNSDTSRLLRSALLKRKRSTCYNFLKMALINLEDEIKSKYLSLNSTIKDKKHEIINLLLPLKWFLELLKKCEMHYATFPLDSLTKLESNLIDSQEDLIKIVDTFIKRCYNLLPRFNADPKKSMPNALQSVKYIQHFLKILKGSVFLSNKEKDEIMNEIPEKIREQVSTKDRLIKSVEEGFTWNIDEFELPYLSKKKMIELRQLYKSKDLCVLNILKIQDPISELNEVLDENSVGKKKYDKLCKTMQFSEKTIKTLGTLVAGQRKIIPANNLINLFQRIKLLKEIIINENEEMLTLWSKTKLEKSRQLIEGKIVRRYLKDLQFQTAVEMLLFDCMILFEGVKLPQFLKIKSSKLFQGVNVRNIISHGNPLVENLCLSLDPQELPSEIVKKMVTLIKGEDAIKAIIELHECLNNDFKSLLEVINLNENDSYCELRSRIKSCSEWEHYVQLLPDTQETEEKSLKNE